MGLLRNLLTSSNAKAHSCTRAGQAQMLIQTAARGMSVATACHRAKKKWLEAGPEDALEDQLLEGLSVPGASSCIGFHHSQGCAQPGRLRLVTLFQKKQRKTAEQGKDSARGPSALGMASCFPTWTPSVTASGS